MTEGSRALRIQLLIGVTSLTLVVYLVLLGRSAIVLMSSGKAAAIGLGVGVFILPVVGLWALIATLRAGFAHQRLGRMAREDGMELDVSALPRTPSGRIQRGAADALFQSVKAELEADPDDWRRWYRLARAYDHAGDRSRARATMKTAMKMEARRT